MVKKITWGEMRKKFPQEWLLIVDFDVDDTGHLISGVVEKHSKEIEGICCPPIMKKPTAFRYTGESTFAGLRNYAQDNPHWARFLQTF
jgi:hypothetical protein